MFGKSNSSSNNNIFSVASSSKFYFNIDGTPHEPNSEAVVKRKTSLRSPIEKNAKTIFSVSTSNSAKSALSNNEEAKTSSLNGGDLNTKTDDFQNASPEEHAKELSMDISKNSIFVIIFAYA